MDATDITEGSLLKNLETDFLNYSRNNNIWEEKNVKRPPHIQAVQIISYLLRLRETLSKVFLLPRCET